MKTINKVLIIAALTATSTVAMAESVSSWVLNIQNRTSVPFIVPELAGACFPKAFIAQGTTSSLPAYVAQAVCGGHQTGTCIADIYTYTGNTCSYPSTKIGTVAIDLSTGAILSSQIDGGYNLNIHGSTLTFS